MNSSILIFSFKFVLTVPVSLQFHMILESAYQLFFLSLRFNRDSNESVDQFEKNCRTEKLLIAIVSSLGQLDEATVPSHSIQHQSGCC